MVELRPRNAKGTVAKADAEEILRDIGAEGGARGARQPEFGGAHAIAKLPALAQFPLVVALSLALSSMGYTFLERVAPGQIGETWKTLNAPDDIALVVGWKALELAVGLFGKLDSYDLAALSVLGRGPSVYLLSTFYNVSPYTALLVLMVDAVSTFVPFQLVRPVSNAHKGTRTTPNREITADPFVQAYTVSLSSVVYSITLFAAYKTFLPLVLVLYFGDIPSVTPAHDATYLSLTPIATVLGLAAKVFIFTPYESTPRTAEDRKLRQFDPVTASLRETFVYNVWGYTAKDKVGILRTAVAVAVTFANTYLQCTKMMAGIDPTGAGSYATVWAVATLLSGVGLCFVGRW